MLAFITDNLLWTEGISIVVFLGFLVFISWLYFKPLLWVILGLFLFSFHFFRNPDRVCPEALRDEAIIISPADGKVVDVDYNPNRTNGYAHKISIFLSPLDVHVNWVPSPGIVEDVAYKPGKFMMAFLPKSSELNERNDICIKCNNGKKILVRQIAGTVARRICCWVRAGDEVDSGHKYGMIRFGSRVDIFLPEEADVHVGLGQAVLGGQTVLGRWT